MILRAATYLIRQGADSQYKTMVGLYRLIRTEYSICRNVLS